MLHNADFEWTPLRMNGPTERKTLRFESKCFMCIDICKNRNPPNGSYESDCFFSQLLLNRNSQLFSLSSIFSHQQKYPSNSGIFPVLREGVRGTLRFETVHPICWGWGREEGTWRISVWTIEKKNSPDFRKEIPNAELFAQVGDGGLNGPEYLILEALIQRILKIASKTTMISELANNTSAVSLSSTPRTKFSPFVGKCSMENRRVDRDGEPGLKFSQKPSSP